MLRLREVCKSFPRRSLSVSMWDGLDVDAVSWSVPIWIWQEFPHIRKCSSMLYVWEDSRFFRQFECSRSLGWSWRTVCHNVHMRRELPWHVHPHINVAVALSQQPVTTTFEVVCGLNGWVDVDEIVIGFTTFSSASDVAHAYITNSNEDRLAMWTFSLTDCGIGWGPGSCVSKLSDGHRPLERLRSESTRLKCAMNQVSS